MRGVVRKKLLPEGRGQEGVATWGTWSGRCCYLRGMVRKELLTGGRGQEGVAPRRGVVRKELPEGRGQE